jgi:(1->4)-alpha-D-glucan 1-alpha-D-glucosylmutase
VEKEAFLQPRIPVATYRLQFNREFTFVDAKNIFAYLHELGITDIYASPYFRARKGSLHGYDVVDHNTLNPEIGTEEQYDGLIEELRRLGMGQILDIVPNHMYIESEENHWWMDVLENGPSSMYAGYFDIIWDPTKKELKNRVLLPVLGDQYGRVLENQELRLIFEEGAFSLEYYDHRFPILPKSCIFILSHRIESLKESLSEEDPHFTELLSIITALNHLPAYTEVGPEKIAERHREKEVIKKRLLTLCEVGSVVSSFIEENVRLFNGTRGDARSFDLLDELLDMQVYRLSHWQVATDEINYRRFFDINGLGAIRAEVPEVFEDIHKHTMRLIMEGKVTGLRVDHPDGLFNPSEYFRKLQRSCFLWQRLGHSEKLNDEISAGRESSDIASEILKAFDEAFAANPHLKPFYVVGEKILIKGERMPEEWPIFSTTGYVFINSLNGLFIDTKSSKAFDDIYFRFIGEKMNFSEIVYEQKNLIMRVAMSGEINTLGHYLNRISEKDRHTRDFTLNSLTNAIREVIAFFPVYRSYINDYSVSDRDRQYIEIAVSKAKRKNPAISESIFDFLLDMLLLRFPDGFEENDKKEWLDFVMKFQQITGPVMAKGLEDTAFYVYNRFVSLNEVGGAPDRFGTPLETFHGQNIERSKFWPHALIASSTHDTKRCEDVRARINVLSEIPGEWRRRVIAWRRLNKKKKVMIDGRPAPDPNEEYLLYQTLVGAWPIGLMGDREYGSFRQRIKDYMVKAIRESKVNTSWINPNASYEEAVLAFIESVMNDIQGNRFLRDIRDFQKTVLHYGLFNSLSQTLLKMTSPGVPDFYQGTEIWDFSLVDPDNRRPVDYGMRSEMLGELKRRESEVGSARLCRDLTEKKEDGRVKLYLTSRGLNFRRDHRELFEEGEYLPLEVSGDREQNVCAFARRLNGSSAIVIVPRFFTSLMSEENRLPLGREAWGNTVVIVPFAREGMEHRDVFTGETVKTKEREKEVLLELSEVLANFPVALLEGLGSNSIL